MADHAWVTGPGGTHAHAVINPRPLGQAAVCGEYPEQGWWLGGDDPLPRCQTCEVLLACVCEDGDPICRWCRRPAPTDSRTKETGT
jgi:hypothetical protein